MFVQTNITYLPSEVSVFLIITPDPLRWAWGVYVIVMWLVCDREADSDCAHLIWRRPGGGTSRWHHQIPGGWRTLML